MKKIALLRPFVIGLFFLIFSFAFTFKNVSTFPTAGIFFDGLLHNCIGIATTNIDTSGTDPILEISNIGDTGNDGIDISLTETKGFGYHSYLPDPNTSPEGAYVDWVFLELNGDVLEEVFKEKQKVLNITGTPRVETSYDASGSGATQLSVTVYDNSNEIVYENIISNNEPAYAVRSQILGVDIGFDNYILPGVPLRGEIIKENIVFITPAGTELLLDAGSVIMVNAVDAPPSTTPISKVELRVAQIGHHKVSVEQIAMFDDALFLHALGSTELVGEQNGTFLNVNEMDGGGDDGIKFDLGEKFLVGFEKVLEFEDYCLTNIITTTDNSYVMYNSEGKLSMGGDLQDFGYIKIQDNSAGYNITTDFTPVGDNNPVYQIYNDGAMVAEMQNVTSLEVENWMSSSAFKTKEAGPTKYSNILFFPTDQNMLVNGESYVGDEIRVVVEVGENIWLTGLETLVDGISSFDVSNASLYIEFETEQIDPFVKIVGDSLPDHYNTTKRIGDFIYAVGSTGMPNSQNTRGIISKYDLTGNLLWTAELDSPSSFNDLVETDDTFSDFLLVGRSEPVRIGNTWQDNQSILCSVNSSGNFNWVNHYDQINRENMAKIIKSSNPIDPSFPFYIAGVENTTTNASTFDNVNVHNINSAGTLNWKKQYSIDSDNEFIRDFLALSNGDLAMFGNHLGITGNMMTIDGNGVVNTNETFDINTSHYFRGAVEIQGTNDYYVIGEEQNSHAFIARIDKQGNEIWSFKMGTQIRFTNIDQATNGDLYTVGLGTVNGISRYMVNKFSPNGQYEWTRYIDKGEQEYLNGYLDILPEGNILYSDCRRDHPYGFGDYDALIGVFDLEMNSECRMDFVDTVIDSFFINSNPVSVSVENFTTTPFQTDGGSLVNLSCNDGCNQAPVICTITCPTDITISTDPGLCSATVNNIPSPTFDGDCSDWTLVSGPLVSEFPIGCNDVTWVYENNNTGLQDVCVFQICVEDNEPPSVTCTDITVNVGNGSIFITPSTIGSATDNCTGTIVTSIDYQLDCSDANNIRVVTYSVIDAAGNSNSCTANVTVEDNVPPIINCPASITVECTLDISNPNNTGGSATATDFCSPFPMISFNDNINSSNSCNNIVIRTWTATDFSGNSSTCAQIITVVDNTPPVITCPSDITIDCSVDYNDPINTGGIAAAMDDCNAIANMDFVDNVLIDMPCETSIERVWTATDDCGNSISCSQFILVIDDVAPVVTNCSADFTIQSMPNAMGECVIAVDLPLPIATDNCNNITMNYMLTGATIAGGASGNLADLNEGVTIVNWIVSDICGNQTTCIYNVEVVCITDSCCLDEMAFMTSVENAINVQVNQDSCKATVNINDLSDCDAITQIDWGDGNSSFGPFGNGDMPMHLYGAVNGVFNITIYAVEFSQDGDTCFTHSFIEAIDLNCPPVCACDGWQSTAFLIQGQTPYEIPTSCGNAEPVLLECPSKYDEFAFHGNFNCTSDCGGNVNWEIIEDGSTTPYLTGTATGWDFGNTYHFDINNIPYPPSGLYALKLTGSCGMSDCTCDIAFEMPECTPDCVCEEPIIPQNGGIITSIHTSECVNALLPSFKLEDECDEVVWSYLPSGQINPIVLGTTNGNNAFSYNFANATGDGTYVICMNVRRTLADGTMCEEEQRCQKVKIKCGSPTIVCNSNIIENPDFSIGAAEGVLGMGGTSESWEYAINPGSEILFDPLATGGVAMVISGNNNMLEAGKTKNELLDGYHELNFDLEKIITTGTLAGIAIHPNTELVMRISEEEQLGAGCEGICQEVVRMPLPIDILTNESYPTFSVYFELDENLIGADRFFTVHIENSSSQAELTSSIKIGSICIESFDFISTSTQNVFFDPEVTIFPNPTSEDLFIQFSNSLTDDLDYKLFDLLGRVIQVGKFKQGNSNYELKMNNYAQGVYILELGNLEKGFFRKRIVKQNP